MRSRSGPPLIIGGGLGPSTFLPFPWAATILLTLLELASGPLIMIHSRVCSKTFIALMSLPLRAYTTWFAALVDIELFTQQVALTVLDEEAL